MNVADNVKTKYDFPPASCTEFLFPLERPFVPRGCSRNRYCCFGIERVMQSFSGTAYCAAEKSGPFVVPRHSVHSVIRGVSALLHHVGKSFGPLNVTIISGCVCACTTRCGALYTTGLSYAGHTLVSAAFFVRVFSPLLFRSRER